MRGIAARSASTYYRDRQRMNSTYKVYERENTKERLFIRATVTDSFARASHDRETREKLGNSCL